MVIVKPATVKNPEKAKDCHHCSADTNTPPGYLEIYTVDSDGMYVYISRCYFCNHRDR